MTSQRKQIIQGIEQGELQAAQVETALRAAGIPPSNSQWLEFINRLFLWLGCLALAVAMLFFIAYNWNDIGRLTKFGFVQAALLISMVCYWRLQLKPFASQAVLMAAAILLGVLLALFGQTYQTGADPWQLFFNWAILLLPWALIGQSPLLWVFWLFLLNLSTLLYFHAFRGGLHVLLSASSTFYWSFLVLNTLALVIWEWLSDRFHWLNRRWPPRLIGCWCMTALTWLTILAILDFPGFWSFDIVLPVLWPLAMALTYAVYRHVKPDLFMLALGCFSGMVVTVVFFARQMVFETAGGFLLIAMVTLALGSGSAIWLHNIHREWQQ